MASSAFQQALANLMDDARKAVEERFTTWLADARLGQVSRNVAVETALSSADFASLLNLFAAQLASRNPEVSWKTACHAHQLRGRRMPDADCPEILGRAKDLGDHAAAIANASRGRGDLTKEEARKMLLKHSTSLGPFGGFETFLRDAPLGNYLVWATFNPDNPRVDPFTRLPNTHEGIRTALGLGHCTPSDALIVLVWKHADSGSPPLHRPTVADAEVYPYYRPRPDADAPWGLTEPLLPNPDGLLPQPEVVMPKTISQGLQLPFRIVQA